MINFSQLIAGNQRADEETRLTGLMTLRRFSVDNRSNGDYDTGNSDVDHVCTIMRPRK